VALYDKGYFSASEIAKCQTLGVTPIVSIPPRASHGDVPTPKYYGEKFIYNKEKDTFLCPENQILVTNGTIYNSPQGPFKQYKTDACHQCAAQKSCTSSQRGIRIIERSEYADNVEKNKELIKENSQLYRLRQEIIEHPFGTMKRQWGYDHTIMKRGKDRVSSDIGLIFIAYNLRRLINILIKNPKNAKNSANLRLKQIKSLQFFSYFLQNFFNSLRLC